MNVTMRFPLCGDKPVIPRSFGTYALSIWQKHIKPQLSGRTRIVTRIVTRTVTLKSRDASHNLVDHFGYRCLFQRTCLKSLISKETPRKHCSIFQSALGWWNSVYPNDDTCVQVSYIHKTITSRTGNQGLVEIQSENMPQCSAIRGINVSELNVERK